MTTSTARPTLPRADLARLITVTVSEVLCLLGTMLGVGVFGGPAVAEAAGGALAADATLLAPATTAFSIWSVIYLGLAVYTVVQWLPSRRTSDRHRRVGWLVAASMLLNAGWLLVVRAGWLWVSVVVIAALVVVLGLLVRRLATSRAPGFVENILVDGTFGLYVGWVSVAVCANVTAALVADGVQVSGAGGAAWAIAVLAVAVVVGVALALRTRGNLGAGLAMAWGIGWLAVARASGEPASTATAVAAALAAVLVLAAAVVTRVRVSAHPA
ncbi:tryptophan-rich sensory protein [Nakamurella sp. YIM 132087]|uniref:Tryptophan-rich sensory protein n=1 Tax=Nakamurella alba TaxID=2665158 RepID=A0A7K1FKT2_9ACTN|nr:tryptophan-rich sensory protein [Nakamurella alba]MTD14745.1 tryptophan-rich sensory protein [Nakamurella alba]